MIDLTGKSEIDFTYTHDKETGNLTLEIFEGESSLGSIKIERNKLMAFLDSQKEAARAMISPLEISVLRGSTSFKTNQGTGKAKFY